ncbi:PAS domain-containing protein [Halodesulfurarchaeum sp. HSR-GB]|uniref:PAS domain-containing protein n=1 Tax=Halodesulfurarchaeum sp. HSR-GB TaxID=3074077 RepID=UPI00285B51E3|nr:PAS domain-containing protein [Halodesulfurarchaeum sp. HSR-GB]MDR5657006.1 PAS domain-containing protein [Halodesulfurarchaeum sp. HSR-GB]
MPSDSTRRIRELEDRVESLEALRDTLLEALEATETYAWEWDIESDTVDRHPAFETLFGVDATELEPIFENFVERVHTAYREDVVEAFETAIEEGSSYHVQYPLTLGDEEIWLEGQGQVVLNDDGTPGRIVGTTRRIPEPEDT